ncbi:protoheme IX farnesyltransferase [Thalassolituus sp. HI0120]|nr:protoheme IX farnesyltransferase [Thalassolituus sp. HI0120]KZZ50265.1 protoheme IX farnesyltransferase [Thalassolituus sp. HI0120]
MGFKTQSLAISEPVRFSDYWTLGKPRVVLVMLVCALAGMLMAKPAIPSIFPVFYGLLGIGLMSMGAAAFNHVLDRRFDRLMARTRQRPLVRDRLQTWQALLYAWLLTLLGFAVLAFEVNILTALLTSAALVGYAVIYTAFLKHATPQNITIGGLAGAAPPLLGWTAVTGSVSADAILLVLIIFAWTPAHFWALAIYRCEEYRQAGVPMLPVTHGIQFTQLQVWLYSWLTVAASLMPYVTGMADEVYLFGILAINSRWLWLNFRVYKFQQAKLMSASKVSFWFSIRYLLYCFLLLLLDHFLSVYAMSG